MTPAYSYVATDRHAGDASGDNWWQGPGRRVLLRTNRNVGEARGGSTADMPRAVSGGPVSSEELGSKTPRRDPDRRCTAAMTRFLRLRGSEGARKGCVEIKQLLQAPGITQVLSTGTTPLRPIGFLNKVRCARRPPSQGSVNSQGTIPLKEDRPKSHWTPSSHNDAKAPQPQDKSHSHLITPPLLNRHATSNATRTAERQKGETFYTLLYPLTMNADVVLTKSNLGQGILVSNVVISHRKPSRRNGDVRCPDATMRSECLIPTNRPPPSRRALTCVGIPKANLHSPTE